MLKITILVLVGLITYFVLRTRKRLPKIDPMYKKDSLKDIRKIQLQIQKKLDENKKNDKK